MTAWLFLVACDVGGRTVHIVEAPSNNPAPTEDTDDSPVTLEQPLPCSYAEVDPTDLDVSYCAGVSPEPGDALPGGAPDPEAAHTSGQDALMQERCGVFNILGVFGTDGAIDTPSSLYCDADAGLRLSQVIGADEAVSYRTLADSCIAVPYAGSIAAVDGGWKTWWLGRADDGTSIVHRSLVSDDGGMDDEILDTPHAYFVVPVAGDPDSALAIDGDGVVRVIDASGVESAPLPSRDHVSAVASPDGILVAGCDNDGHLSIVRHGATDETLFERDGCGWSYAPRIASGLSGFALAWRHDEGTSVLVNGVETVFPEGGATALAADGDTWIAVVGASVMRIGADGVVTATRRHPVLAAAGDDVDQIDVAVMDDHLLFQVVNLSAITVPPHVFVYNRLELSATSAP